MDDNSGDGQEKIMVSINRRLGTYFEMVVMTNRNSRQSTTYDGTCLKREGF
jgi:hypothetical protein